MSNPFLGPLCPPERGGQTTRHESLAAQLWVREAYRRHIAVAEGSRFEIASENDDILNVFRDAQRSNDPVIDLAAEMVIQEFRNTQSSKTSAELEKLRRARQRAETELVSARGTPAEAQKAKALDDIKRDASNLWKVWKPGGRRKPDILGIAVNSRVLLDLVEVGTLNTARGTYDELQGKLQQLQSVAKRLQLELPRLRELRGRGIRTADVPAGVEARASPFRLPRYAYVVPLPISVDKSSGKGPHVDWLCYQPTSSYSPNGVPPSNGNGLDGLVLYHIHRIFRDQVELPVRVRAAFRSAEGRWKYEHGLGRPLTLLPQDVLWETRSQWSQEALQLFGWMGAGALLMLFAFVALETGVFTAMGTLAFEGYSVLAATPEVLEPALAAALAYARSMWPVVEHAAMVLKPT